MLKNTQYKVIFIFFIVAILIIGGLGVFFFNSLDELQKSGATIEQIKNQTKIFIIVAISVFILIGIIVAKVLSKYVIYPINKLIQSAEKITDEKKAVKKSDRNNIENVLGIMTTEFVEKYYTPSKAERYAKASRWFGEACQKITEKKFLKGGGLLLKAFFISADYREKMFRYVLQLDLKRFILRRKNG